MLNVCSSKKNIELQNNATQDGRYNETTNDKAQTQFEYLKNYWSI